MLVVTTREPGLERTLNGVAGTALRFLGEAQALTGACRNRMDSKGNWIDEPALEDCLGALRLGSGDCRGAQRRRLGATIGHHAVRARRAGSVRRGRGRWRSRHWALPRCSRSTPRIAAARLLIIDYAASVAEPNGDAAWPWPEPRLTYANAVLPEAMIAAGDVLDDAPLRQRGLDLLAWLLDCETTDGHLSVTPVGGRGPGDERPAFDQQPIEVSSLADACARAATVDSDAMWPDGVRAAAAWFQGDNDAGQLMWDPETGGGFDGLHADGVNRNQGAESTLAVLSTLQHAQRFSAVPQ